MSSSVPRRQEERSSIGDKCWLLKGALLPCGIRSENERNRNDVKRNVGTKVYMDLKYIWRTAALDRHNVLANHPDTPPGFELFTFLKTALHLK